MAVLIEGMDLPDEKECARPVILFADGHAETMGHARYELMQVPEKPKPDCQLLEEAGMEL